jgi:hypothetical protein
MTVDTLVSRVKSSGLQLLEVVSDESVLDVVWSRIIGGDVVPEIRIPDVNRANTLEVLAARWVERMKVWGVAEEGENFLIGLPGSPPEVALVKMAVEIDLSSLGLYPGEPEFVACNLDRSVAVGVTVEEREFWIVRVD